MPSLDRETTQLLAGAIRPITGDARLVQRMVASLASLVPLDDFERDYVFAWHSSHDGAGHVLALAGQQLLHAHADDNGVVARSRLIRNLTTVELLDVADLDSWQGGLSWTVVGAALTFADDNRIDVRLARESGDTQRLGALISEIGSRRSDPSTRTGGQK